MPPIGNGGLTGEGFMQGTQNQFGFLPDQLVLTGFRITPVVAKLAADFTPRPADSEVQEAFLMPFSVLLDQASHVHNLRQIGGLEFEVRDLQYGVHRIWGATAGMLFALYEMARS